MIFLSVGTQLRFDRLVRAVDDWCGSRRIVDVFGQITSPGRQGYVPRHFPWVDFLDPREYEHRVQNAHALVAHAGMGSIITALTLGKPILVLPRKAALGEQRNDHQLATCEWLRNKPGVLVAKHEDELPDLLTRLVDEGRSAAAMQRLGLQADHRLIAELRRLIVPKSPGTRPGAETAVARGACDHPGTPQPALLGAPRSRLDGR